MSAQHGSTPAAWTAVVLLLVAFIVGGVGLMMGSMTVFWVGVAIAPVAVVAGAVMARMGYGAD